MLKKIRKLSSIPFHPILFGLYPVLALYLLNIGETTPLSIGQAIISSLLLTAITSVGLYVFFHPWRAVATLISFSLIMILTYGHIYYVLEGSSVAGFVFGRHRYLLPLWGIVLMLGIYNFGIKKIGSAWGRGLNTISSLMIASLFAQIALNTYQSSAIRNQLTTPTQSSESLAPTATKRDVYYILLDAYSRQDVLNETFNLDNSDFINELENLGFFIPQCTQGNYFTTYSSMSSTLNMNFLDTLGIDPAVANPTIYAPFIQDSKVFQIFRDLGYQTITFKSLNPTIDIKNSTHYFDVFEKDSIIGSSASINFQYLFLKTTILLPVMEYLETLTSLDLSPSLATWIPVGKSKDSREYRQYQQSVFALETLESLPTLPGRKFVYAHLLITHQPFVFSPDGQFQDALPQDHNAYRDQVIFANKKMLQIVKVLLDSSDVEPIIILQSDHSYMEGNDRVKILNAYYLPDGGNQTLYESITPVNTFRVIFNTYFGANYELLPDVSTYMEGWVDNVRDLRLAPSTCVEH